MVALGDQKGFEVGGDFFGVGAIWIHCLVKVLCHLQGRFGLARSVEGFNAIPSGLVAFEGIVLGVSRQKTAEKEKPKQKPTAEM